MKRLIQLTCGLFFIAITSQSFASNLNYKTPNSLRNHLTEVNKEWAEQIDVSNLNLEENVVFLTDNERIKCHLSLVLKTLENRAVNHLSVLQMQKRKEHLAMLKKYIEIGIFPTNHYHSHRQPYFVDNFGVHCAVGFLLEQDGQTDFVTKIRQNDNYAYIRELTKYSTLTIWAKENGFTLDELAWIQPTYYPEYTYESVGNGVGVNGKILCMTKSDDGNTLYLGGNFVSIDNIASSSVMAFDGDNFQAIGGILGTVHDMKFYFNDLYVAGNFILPQSNDFVNVAKWNGTTWEALQVGDMEGTIYTLEIWNGVLYIGGNFQKVNGVTMPYLAYLNAQNQWSNEGAFANNSQYATYSNGFTVNAPVYDFEQVSGRLVVAGAFTQVAEGQSSAIFPKFTTNYVAYWNTQRYWEAGLHGTHDEVRFIKYRDGKLFVGSKYGQYEAINILDGGLWNTRAFPTFDDNKIHDILFFNEKMFAVGGIRNGNFLVGTYGRGIFEISEWFGNWGSEGAAMTNGTVNVAIEFKNRAYFAGDFDTIGFSPIRGLAVSDLDINISTQPIQKDANQYKVWAAEQQIFIEKSNFDTKKMTFQLFDVNGRLVKMIPNIQDSRTEISTNSLTKGVYFYRISTENGQESGKLIVGI